MSSSPSLFSPKSVCLLLHLGLEETPGFFPAYLAVISILSLNVRERFPSLAFVVPRTTKKNIIEFPFGFLSLIFLRKLPENIKNLMIFFSCFSSSQPARIFCFFAVRRLELHRSDQRRMICLRTFSRASISMPCRELEQTSLPLSLAPGRHEQVPHCSKRRASLSFR